MLNPHASHYTNMPWAGWQISLHSYVSLLDHSHLEYAPGVREQVLFQI